MALQQLGHFLGEFKGSESRNAELDRDIIDRILNFLLRKQQPEDKGIYEAFVWLGDFLRYFEEDFTLWQAEEAEYLAETINQSQTQP
jgi:hypothetical protein